MRYSEVRAFLADLTQGLVDPAYGDLTTTPSLTPQGLLAGLESLPDLAEVSLFHSWRCLEEPPSDFCVQSGEILLEALMELCQLHESLLLSEPTPPACETALFHMLQQLDQALGVWQTSVGAEEYSEERPELLLHRLKYCRWIVETALILARLLAPADPYVLAGLEKLESELKRTDWYEAFEFDDDDPTASRYWPPPQWLP